MTQEPLILVTNDDGYTAKGVNKLAKLATEFGKVVLIAPDSPQSGQSSALTVEAPVQIQKVSEEEKLTIYKCSGTPADCVKLAVNQILERQPDFIFSGINHGSNTSVNVIYSGTMGAALEGCLVGIPSIGFSITSHSPNADFSQALVYCRQIMAESIAKGLPAHTCLNINIPEGTIKGVKVCRQSQGRWHKEYVKKEHPRGGTYYWLTGEYINLEPTATDTDIWAIENGYISVVPTHTDLTKHQELDTFSQWNYEIADN